MILRGDSYIKLRMQCDIMTQITWSSHPVLVASFQGFLKNVLNVLEAKKVDYIFEEPPHLYLIIFLVGFFSLLLWIPAESTSNLKKLFNSNHRLRWNTTANIQAALDFLLKSYSNVSDILKWRWYLPYYFWLQKLIQKQAQKAYKQANNFL